MYSGTYFLFHLLGDVLHVEPAGRLAYFVTFKHGHPFYLCFDRQVQNITGYAFIGGTLILKKPSCAEPLKQWLCV